jgi:aspartate/glutamate racemase
MPGSPTAQHIGIVACSAEGAALCYRTICREGADLMGPHAHPEVSLHTHALADSREAACDAVVLGCTEIPLLINDDNSPLPTLDSTRLLARAALRRAFAA